jgi:hypothetical protein
MFFKIHFESIEDFQTFLMNFYLTTGKFAYRKYGQGLFGYIYLYLEE